MCYVKPRHYQVLHLCHSETTDEQSNFTQAWIQPAWRQLWKRCQCGAVLLAQDERNLREQRKREIKWRGGEKGRHAQTCMLPIRHSSDFYSCKNCQVHYTARREKHEFEFCSWHSVETLKATSLYFTQHWAQAFLFVQCNANSNLSLCVTPLETFLTQRKSKATWSHNCSPLLSHCEFCTVTAAAQASLCLTKEPCLLYCITE